MKTKTRPTKLAELDRQIQRDCEAMFCSEVRVRLRVAVKAADAALVAHLLTRYHEQIRGMRVQDLLVWVTKTCEPTVFQLVCETFEAEMRRDFKRWIAPTLEGLIQDGQTSSLLLLQRLFQTELAEQPQLASKLETALSSPMRPKSPEALRASIEIAAADQRLRNCYKDAVVDSVENYLRNAAEHRDIAAAKHLLTTYAPQLKRMSRLSFRVSEAVFESQNSAIVRLFCTKLAVPMRETFNDWFRTALRVMLQNSRFEDLEIFEATFQAQLRDSLSACTAETVLCALSSDSAARAFAGLLSRLDDNDIKQKQLVTWLLTWPGVSLKDSLTERLAERLRALMLGGLSVRALVSAAASYNSQQRTRFSARQAFDQVPEAQAILQVAEKLSQFRASAELSKEVFSSAMLSQALRLGTVASLAELEALVQRCHSHGRASSTPKI